MVGPVKPATSPRIRRSTSISHKSLGPWDQVFNHRGSRRDWPKDMWICLALFGHCSRTQVFQPLPSLQLLVPFHLPGHGAKRGRQQDRVISQKLKWSCNQSKVGFLNLVYFWVFHWFSQAMDYSYTHWWSFWSTSVAAASSTYSFLSRAWIDL